MNRRRFLLPSILHHVVLAVLAIIWLTPILWLVVTSFGVDEGPNIRSFFPEGYTLEHYRELLFSADSVSNFPQWFTNTLIVAVFTCVISTAFVLMTAYAMSFLRFRGRKGMMKTAIILNLFPGFLGMIAVYFILREIELTNTLPGLVIVYSASAGIDYLIAKGFFDTVSRSLREAAYLEGANEWTVFRRIILPLAKPIVVYTVINSFLFPWMDFVYASIIMSSGIATDKTVALGLFSMVDKVNRNRYFAQFCAGGVLVSIPIAVLFIIRTGFARFAAMQTKIDGLNNTVQENVTNVRVVKSFVREDYENQKFGKANRDLRQTGTSAMSVMIFMQPVMTLFMNLTVAAVLWFGGNMVLDAGMPVGDLSAFVTYVNQILFSLMMVTMMLMNSSAAFVRCWMKKRTFPTPPRPITA